MPLVLMQNNLVRKFILSLLKELTYILDKEFIRRKRGVFHILEYRLLWKTRRIILKKIIKRKVLLQ